MNADYTLELELGYESVNVNEETGSKSLVFILLNSTRGLAEGSEYIGALGSHQWCEI